MPTVPTTQTLKATGADILNAIRNNASVDYRNYVPAADDTLDSIRAVGNIIMDMPALRNEFLTALLNRIARVVITSKAYTNKWSMFKKGLIELGETVEEVFVNLANPHEFDPSVAENEVYKREIPDVRAAFHTMNYQKFYKTTVSRDQLRQAFLSWDGINNLVNEITRSLYTGMEYDEFQTMKYLIACAVLDGRMTAVSVPSSVGNIQSASSDALRTAVGVMKGVSDDLTFLRNDYNPTGVYTTTDKENQYLIINTAANARIDTEVLAAAFNMTKAEFTGHTVLVDGFGRFDSARLEKLFEGDPNFKNLTSAEMTALNQIPCVLVDKDWFMIFDNLLEMKSKENEEGLYFNYWLHSWKTFSTSPFANAVLFVPGDPAVTSVDVSPSSASLAAGQSLGLTATVATTKFGPQSVDWTITSSDDSTVERASVSRQGVVTLATNAVSGNSYTVTATSTFDSTKSASATITVA